MAAVVAPLDHTLPIGVDEVKTTFPPVQKEVDPLAVITGVLGVAFTVTVTIVLGPSYPFASCCAT
jgi:hypothetical protein